VRSTIDRTNLGRARRQSSRL